MRLFKHPKGLVITVLSIAAVSALVITTTSCDLSQKMTPSFRSRSIDADDLPLFGMWVWQPQWIGKSAEQNRLIRFCKEHGINRLLVQIHLEPDWEHEGIAQLQYRTQLKRLLSMAAKTGIRIEALDGAPEMGNARNHAKALAVLDAVLEFNRTLPLDRRFIGIHYDIEPYATPDWHTEKRTRIMREYLDLFKYVRAKLAREDPPMQLAASIPFWYDQLTDKDNTCITVYRGERKNFHEHIQDLTDYVAIMSYRRTAVGKNSITDLIASEVEYASHIGRFACAGMETIDLPESPELSFSDMTPESFWSVKGQIDRHMAERNGFGGVFVHDYKGFRKLVEGSRDQQNNTAQAKAAESMPQSTP